MNAISVKKISPFFLFLWMLLSSECILWPLPYQLESGFVQHEHTAVSVLRETLYLQGPCCGITTGVVFPLSVKQSLVTGFAD